VNIPSEIRAGDTVKWRDDSSTDVFGNEIKSDEWTLKYYLRSNVRPGLAHTTTGSVYSTGWEFTISATDSAAFDSGDWYWQAIASKGSEKITLGYGKLTVEVNLEYSGIPGAFDGRTQAKKDLDAVQAAIRTLISGGAVQEYKIGNRNLKRYDLPDLIQLEGRLKAEVKREEQAEMIANGLGNPRNMFVRFN
tara:strand:- start:132 stop:707 length:576 start_codon:yes stop_codon:yes gene_type:complete